MQVGSTVKVLSPFGDTYNGTYTIVSIDGDVYFLDGIDGGFCIDYLEVV